MKITVTIIVVAMGVVALALLVLALIYFCKSTGERPNSKSKDKVSPVVQRYFSNTKSSDIRREKERRQAEQEIYEQSMYQPQPEPVYQPQPEPISENIGGEEVAVASDDGAISFEVSQTARRTLAEEYALLPYYKKKWFDAITRAMYELDKARIKELKYTRNAIQGQDTIARLQFIKGEMCLDCTIVNADLKVYSKSQGTKIKTKPMRFRITDEEQLDAAIYTLNVSNRTALEIREMRKKAKKSDKTDI